MEITQRLMVYKRRRDDAGEMSSAPELGRKENVVCCLKNVITTTWWYSFIYPLNKNPIPVTTIYKTYGLASNKERKQDKCHLLMNFEGQTQCRLLPVRHHQYIQVFMYQSTKNNSFSCNNYAHICIHDEHNPRMMVYKTRRVSISKVVCS